MTSMKFPIIDSHIHLYPATHLPRLNWTADLPPDHILNRQSSIDEYRAAVTEPHNVLGFVFLETDRKFAHNESGWKDPLEEVEYLARIAQGKPISGEGHTALDSRLVLGIVPWAPLPAGPSELEKYVTQVRQACGDKTTFALVKGFRYLVQDKPKGTMLEPDFIAGLQWLGEKKYVFDLGVDSRSGGTGQLQEACQMLEKVNANGNELRVIINHFCKPNLRLTAEECSTGHADFLDWKSHMEKFASYPNTFMKLSGFFSELPPQTESKPSPISGLLQRIKPWAEVVFSAFGPSRIMFGSDWPVCSAGGPGTKSWLHWERLVAALLDDFQMNDQQKSCIWGETAQYAYNIDLDS